MAVTLLVDGNNLAYRCNSVTELSTKDGRRTSAIYGVLNSIPGMVREVADELDKQPSEIVVAWDYGKNRRRMEVYPDYKGNRHHTDTEVDRTWYEEFIEQTNTLHGMLPLIGVKSLKVKGQEADDLIYTYIALARQNRDDEDNYFIIVSADEDFLQLVGEDTAVYSPQKKVMYTDLTFPDIVGLQPSQFMDFKVLKGDSSDNIKGIQGIGDVTGKKLIAKYGSLHGLLTSRDPDLLKSKVTSRIFTPEGLTILDRNNRLINLADYVDLTETQDDIQAAIQEQPAVSDKGAKAFLMEYQLSSILVKYQEWIRLFKQVNLAYYS